MTRILVPLALWLICSCCYAQHVASTTQIVEKLLKGALGEVFSSKEIKWPVSIQVAPHPDAPWIEAIAQTVASEQGVQLVEKNAVVERGAERLVSIVAADVSTKYLASPSADSVLRVITVHLHASVVGGDEVFIVATQPRTDSALCRRDDALAAQSSQHNSTHASLPNAPSSFWDDAAQPLIFVAAAVTTVVLLFTVRSK